MKSQEENKSYILTEEQQNILAKQIDLDIKVYTEASLIYLNLIKKYNF